MITVYGIPHCDTVKKARSWLDENNIPYQFHDYKKKGITAEKIQSWCGTYSWVKLVNKAGTTWKSLSEDDKAKVSDEKSAVALMVGATSIIKRPLIEGESGMPVALGFSVKEYQDTFL